MKKLKITGMSILMLLFSSLGTFAQDVDSHKENREHKMQMQKRQSMKKKKSHIPNLTEKQKEQLKSARIKLQRETLPFKNALREKKARLQTLTSTEGSTEKEINKVIDEIGVLKTKIMKARVANHINTKKFLTEEQKLFMDSHRNMWKQGHKIRG